MTLAIVTMGAAAGTDSLLHPACAPFLLNVSNDFLVKKVLVDAVTCLNTKISHESTRRSRVPLKWKYGWEKRRAECRRETSMRKYNLLEIFQGHKDKKQVNASKTYMTYSSLEYLTHSRCTIILYMQMKWLLCVSLKLENGWPDFTHVCFEIFVEI